MSRAFLPYGNQVIDDSDVDAVVDVLRSAWLTTGPAVEAFEAALAEVTGARHAVVCNSGTAALYLAYRALQLQPGDSVVVPAVTFVATASAAILAGLDVILADVDADTGLMGIDDAEAAIRRSGHPRVRAVCPVHLGGRVGDIGEMQAWTHDRGLLLVEDACHGLGTEYGEGRHRVGGCGHSVAACFSFHPVKTITMGEGGAVTTNSADLAERMRLLRSHGIERRPEEMANRELAFNAGGTLNPSYYEVADISHNFRASDVNCALGRSQLRKLPAFLDTRRALMRRYEELLAPLGPQVRLVASRPDSNPGWHLCGVLVDFEGIGIDRVSVMQRLRERGVGSQVHYIPIHRQPYYRRLLPSLELPGADAYYARALSLPLSPSMTGADVEHVVSALRDSL